MVTRIDKRSVRTKEIVLEPTVPEYRSLHIDKIRYLKYHNDILSEHYEVEPFISIKPLLYMMYDYMFQYQIEKEVLRSGFGGVYFRLPENRDEIEKVIIRMPKMFMKVKIYASIGSLPLFRIGRISGPGYLYTNEIPSEMEYTISRNSGNPFHDLTIRHLDIYIMIEEILDQHYFDGSIWLGSRIIQAMLREDEIDLLERLGHNPPHNPVMFTIPDFFTMQVVYRNGRVEEYDQIGEVAICIDCGERNYEGYYSFGATDPPISDISTHVVEPLSYKIKAVYLMPYYISESVTIVKLPSFASMKITKPKPSVIILPDELQADKGEILIATALNRHTAIHNYYYSSVEMYPIPLPRQFGYVLYKKTGRIEPVG